MSSAWQQEEQGAFRGAAPRTPTFPAVPREAFRGLASHQPSWSRGLRGAAAPSGLAQRRAPPGTRKARPSLATRAGAVSADRASSEPARAGPREASRSPRGPSRRGPHSRALPKRGAAASGVWAGPCRASFTGTQQRRAHLPGGSPGHSACLRTKARAGRGAGADPTSCLGSRTADTPVSPSAPFGRSVAPTARPDTSLHNVSFVTRTRRALAP